LVHVATLISLSPLSSLSNVVCIHIDQNTAEQKQCSNVAM
jgi:phage terminase large subunit-like protein